MAVWPLWITDPRLRGLAINTLALSASSAVIAGAMGVPLALFLTRIDLPLRRVGLALAALLLFMPLYLHAAAWQAGWGVQGALLPLVGSQPLIAGWFGAIWIHAVAGVGWVTLIAGAGFLSVERELEEDALLDMPATRVVMQVTLRRAWPAILIALLWVMIATAGEMTVTNLFQVRVFSEELYTQLSLGEGWGEIALTGLPVLLVTTALVVATLWAVRRLLPALLATGNTPLLWPVGGARGGLTAVMLAILLLLIGVPLGSLLIKAGLTIEAGSTGERIRGWSAWKCAQLIVSSPWQFRREFGGSMVLAIASSVISMALGAALAWWAARRPRARWAVLAVVAICLATPAPAAGLAIIWLFNWPSWAAVHWLYDQSIAPPTLALVVRETPIVTLILWHALARVPRPLWEQAALDGLGRWTVLTRLIAPRAWRALLAAWIAAMVLALGDLAATILVLPPGVETIALRMFERLHYGAEDQVAGISLALVGLVGLAGWVVARLLSAPMGQRTAERSQRAQRELA
ncbi:MAG: ABC transporter permease subunit [Pirellulales bacterium]|nr:ABC transporter permease subunit [Pirellulales bacterium]